jgi:CheY-like chemotaxis protein
MTIRVLVIGNSQDNANLARSALAPLECEVSPVTSIALGLYLAHKNLPDLIVANNEMADGNGLDLLRELKADTELKDIPFVFICSGKNTDAILSKGVAAGADKVIARPESPSEFIEQVLPFLRERKQCRPEESPE